MLLPSVDFEMTYWRLRRHARRMRAMLRDRAARVKADLNLRHVQMFRRRPEPLEPEETFVYRLMWALVVIGLVVVLALEARQSNDDTTQIVQPETRPAVCA